MFQNYLDGRLCVCPIVLETAAAVPQCVVSQILGKIIELALGAHHQPEVPIGELPKPSIVERWRISHIPPKNRRRINDGVSNQRARPYVAILRRFDEPSPLTPAGLYHDVAA